jgi:hypothetical protein
VRFRPPRLAGRLGTGQTPGTARAYGLVALSGTVIPANSKNIAAITRPFTGIYCVTVTGVSAATDGATATPNYANDTTGSANIAHVEWNAGSGSCPSSSQFEFQTFEVTVSGGALVDAPANQSFFFIVP